jgi:hypothetical protein
MYIGNSYKTLVKIYPSIYKNLTHGFIPNYLETFNSKFKEFESKDLKYFNFKHDYSPNYNEKIKISVQLNKFIKNLNGYTSVSEIKDSRTNTYIYEFMEIYELENDFAIRNEFRVDNSIHNMTNLSIKKSSNLDSILNNLSTHNFGLLADSGISQYEKILFNILSSPENYQNNQNYNNKIINFDKNKNLTTDI